MSILTSIKTFNEFVHREMINRFETDPLNLQIEVANFKLDTNLNMDSSIENRKNYLDLLINIEKGAKQFIDFSNAKNSVQFMLDYQKESKNEIDTINTLYDYLLSIANKINLDTKEIQIMFNDKISYINDLFSILKEDEKLFKEINAILNSYSAGTISDVNKQEIIEDINIALKRKNIDSISDCVKLKEKYENIHKNLNTDILDFTDFFNFFKNEIKNKNINYCSTLADKYEYYTNLDNNSLTTKFLLSKQFEEEIQADLVLSKSQTNSRYILFNDNSMISYDKEEKLTNHFSSKDIIDLVKKDTLQFVLRKNPSLYKTILRKAEEEFNFDNAFILTTTILNNINTIKNLKISLDDFENKSMEVIDDKLNNLITEEKIKSFTYSIVSNKYKHLIDEETVNIFKEFYYSGFNSGKMQSLIGKKIAAYKTSEEFNDFVKNVFNSLSEFKEDVLIDKLELVGLKPVYNEDKVYVIEIPTYYICKSLGSPQWCIVRDEYYFDSYTGSNNKQYFLFNFNKNEKDSESMIGFTLYNNGNFKTQHLKDDDYFEVNSELTNIRDFIVMNNKESFELSKDLIEEIESRNKKYKKKSLSMESV